jgi:hypothetical protein
MQGRRHAACGLPVEAQGRARHRVVVGGSKNDEPVLECLWKLGGSENPLLDYVDYVFMNLHL